MVGCMTYVTRTNQSWRRHRIDVAMIRRSNPQLSASTATRLTSTVTPKFVKSVYLLALLNANTYMTSISSTTPRIGKFREISFILAIGCMITLDNTVLEYLFMVLTWIPLYYCFVLFHCSRYIFV